MIFSPILLGFSHYLSYLSDSIFQLLPPHPASSDPQSYNVLDLATIFSSALNYDLYSHLDRFRGSAYPGAEDYMGFNSEQKLVYPLPFLSEQFRPTSGARDRPMRSSWLALL